MLPTLDADTVVSLVASLAVLLAAARLLGHLARRFGIPPVVGELAAGVLLGPTVLGALAPGVGDSVVPDQGTVRVVLDGFAWLGLILLLASAGATLDLQVVGQRLRSGVWLSVLSLAVPLMAGLALGGVLPSTFFGDVDRLTAAAFVAVILAVSSVPTIARTLSDLKLLHHDVGQLTLSLAAFDDLIGWVLLGVLTAGVDAGGFTLGSAALRVTLFFVAAWLVGRRAVDVALGISLRLTGTVAGPLTTAIVIIFATVWAAAALGMDVVIGALVAGMLLGTSASLRPRVQASMDEMTSAVFGPLFFALAGAALDLGELAGLSDLAWTAGLIAVAIASKVGGAILGVRLSGLPDRLGLAVGLGLSARGGLGIVVASVALSVGALSTTGFAAAVVLAVVTSMIAPPLFGRASQNLADDEGERERLSRQAILKDSVAIGARRVLLLTRGGANSRVAARALDLAIDQSAEVTVLSVDGPGDDTDVGGLGHGEPGPSGVALAMSTKDAAEAVAALLGHRRVRIRVVQSKDVAAAMRTEIRRGYDLVVVGASGDVQTPRQLGTVLQKVLMESPVPVMIVRSRTDTEGLVFRRLLTVATGTRETRAAQDIAFALARNGGADVDVAHVIARSDRILDFFWNRDAAGQPAPRLLLGEAVSRAALFGVVARPHTRFGSAPSEELLEAGRDLQADTLVIATKLRAIGDELFLGHGVEYLLELASQNLIVLLFPASRP